MKSVYIALLMACVLVSVVQGQWGGYYGGGGNYYGGHGLGGGYYGGGLIGGGLGGWNSGFGRLGGGGLLGLERRSLGRRGYY
uniref:Uncharacterized protein n=1 Tax=Magallana gigas TaxID=29159 RepID=K1QUY8_MAGGI